MSHDQHTATALPHQHITTHKKRSIAAHARMGMYTARNSPRLLALARVCAYSQVRDRLLFAYGFKDTEPWPQFAQSLQIPRDQTGRAAERGWVCVNSIRYNRAHSHRLSLHSHRL